jgi:hypothetical protein
MWKQEDSKFTVSTGKIARPPSQNTNNRAGSIAQMTEILPSMHENQEGRKEGRREDGKEERREGEREREGWMEGEKKEGGREGQYQARTSSQAI